MEIKSLGFQTNLIFSRYSGTVTDKGAYTLIQTPSNPGFHWGNYLVFDRPPNKGDLLNWKALFDKEFTYYREPHHYVFAWEENSSKSTDYQEFLDAGFEYASAVVLTAERLKPPPKLNSRLKVLKISTERQWREVLALQIALADPKYLNPYYEDFKTQQMAEYRAMSKAGHGHWYGAYLDGKKLVGDLGIFHDGAIGRYQNVGTHPDYRRQGVCGTLVNSAGRQAMDEFGLRHLVMEADPGYHAARIYESVGFQRNEVNHALSWWKSKGKS